MARRAWGPSVARRLFLNVIDQAGKPVTGLTTADFTIVEAGTTRQITRVSPALDPMRLVLLIDTSHNMQPWIEEIRSGDSTTVSIATIAESIST